MAAFKRFKEQFLPKVELHFQGYPRIELQARARGNSLMDARLILVGNRLYMLMAIATADRDRKPKTIRRSFDSFKLSPK